MKTLRHLLAVICHPATYCRLKAKQEKLALFAFACCSLKIESPLVWDVDRLHESINGLLDFLSRRDVHEEKHFKSALCWTLLALKFKKLVISREETKKMLDMHNSTVDLLKRAGVDASGFDAAALHFNAVKSFGLR